MAKTVTNLKEFTLTNFPERDDVQWMKHSFSRLDAKHVENAQATCKHRKAIYQSLDDQMNRAPPAKRVARGRVEPEVVP